MNLKSQITLWSGLFPLLLMWFKKKTFGVYNLLLTSLFCWAVWSGRRNIHLHLEIDFNQYYPNCCSGICQVLCVYNSLLSAPSPKVININIFLSSCKDIFLLFCCHTAKHTLFYRALLSTTWPLLLTALTAWMQTKMTPNWGKIWIYMHNIPFRKRAFSSTLYCWQSHMMSSFGSPLLVNKP